MNKKKAMFLSFSVLDIVFRVVMWVVIVYFVIKGATRCYDLGYRVFTEDPMAPEGYGREVTVEIPVDFTAKELGELFEEKGLSRDSILFALQYYASEYREGVKGGTYTFSTDQTAEDMFAQIAEITASAEELDESVIGEPVSPNAENIVDESVLTEEGESEEQAETEGDN
ncbi:MAG: hypothetical protein J6I66_02740 [Lachnospiraceae bacterium]|nr:hypothetical protein [Clostridiales bacterium]MBP3753755.1 hypothetical protein [Lachnospiraceae bacterium]